jgi:hypothetical protein
MNTVGQTITAILTNIFTSASKLVFLMIATTLCAAFFMKLISQENFIYLAGNVFSYYFGVAQGQVGAQTPLPPQPPRDPDAIHPEIPPATTVTKTETTTTAPPTVPGVK